MGASATSSSVEELVAACPTAAEIQAFNTDFAVTFEGDPTAGTLVCTAAAGSADLTRLQERAYQALRVIRELSFSQPLPWTSQSLYDWLRGAIRGIRFRSDIEFSFCCEPANTIDIQTRNLAAIQTTRWIDPSLGIGLDGLVDVIVHEARHNQTGGHTCGTSDATVSELGAWGVEYYLRLWEGLFAGSLLTAPAGMPSSYYRFVAVGTAESYLDRFICKLPGADLALTASAAPDPVREGANVTYSVRVSNAGPDTAPASFVYDDPPTGLAFQSATASQGTCSGAVGGATACALGALPPGGSATVSIAYKAAAGPATLTYPEPLAFGVHATGPVRDPNAANNSMPLTIHVVPVPKATPKKPVKKPVPRCKKGQRSTKKHPCRKR